jgi:hypothetical protein
MAVGNKVHFIILGIVVHLLFSTDIRAEEVKTRDDAARQEIVTGPEQHEVSLVSLYPWVVEGEALGTVAAYVYGDVTTERPADYWELYDKKGNLLAISWFDRFGIQRTAIDRGIVEEGNRLARARNAWMCGWWRQRRPVPAEQFKFSISVSPTSSQTQTRYRSG